MTRWHAVVPVKPVAERKTRLHGSLSPDAITDLTRRMLGHVLRVAQATEAIGSVTLLAAERFDGWTGHWFPDPGTGLNAALAAVAGAVPERMVVLHADLPALSADDVAALVSAAEAGGSAISPERRGAGTNALALHDARGFAFAFGPGSFALHRAALPECRIVDRPGLALDIDLPEDVELAVRLGHLPPLWRG